MKKTRLIYAFFLSYFAVLTLLAAGVVETHDGARLTGEITAIAGGVIHLETNYAGLVEVDLSKVSGFATEEEVFVRLKDGHVLAGRVQLDENGGMKSAGGKGRAAYAAGEVEALWRAGAEDPETVKLRKEMEALKRRWTYKAALDLRGKRGNSEEFSLAAGMSAALKGPDDALKLYGSVDYAEQSSRKTSEEIKGGMDFSAGISGRWGWFTRMELETDEFEDIDLRATAAAGFSYLFIKRANHTFQGRLGLNYLHENYENGGSGESPGLDAALKHDWQFAEWARALTDITWTPAFEDFSDYLLTQDTALELPLGLSDVWKLRVGLANYYNSRPARAKENLDTIYYTRLILSWE